MRVLVPLRRCQPIRKRKAGARGATLPQVLESAARFPQHSGHDDERLR